MGLRDKIVSRIETTDRGKIVHTEGGRRFGPFKHDSDMFDDPDIGQRAMNYMAGQGAGRLTPRFYHPNEFD